MAAERAVWRRGWWNCRSGAAGGRRGEVEGNGTCGRRVQQITRRRGRRLGGGSVARVVARAVERFVGGDRCGGVGCGERHYRAAMKASERVAGVVRVEAVGGDGKRRRRRERCGGEGGGTAGRGRQVVAGGRLRAMERVGVECSR